jgi:hypothetical protein
MCKKNKVGHAIAQSIDVRGDTAEGVGVAKTARVPFQGGNDGAGGLFALVNPEPMRPVDGYLNASTASGASAGLSGVARIESLLV